MFKLGIIMDKISTINIKKDSSFAMLLEAQRRNYQLYYMEIDSLYIYKNKAKAITKLITVINNTNNWYTFSKEIDIELNELDIILMRKNPPFNKKFLYATYILEIAEKEGVFVFNKPKSLRDFNEKLFTIWFSEFIPDTLVSNKYQQIKKFLKKHKKIVLKPLNQMGGKSIFFLREFDPNISVIIENMTNFEQKLCIAQNYIPDIKNGDKRIIIVNGIPIPYCLARIPKKHEIRGNIIAGGNSEVRSLNKQDWKIANYLAPLLKDKGLIFVGLDVIGNYLTEINITSPTCICEIEAEAPISITNILFDSIEGILKH